MKRILMLALLCAFVLGVAASASAADLKASGTAKIEARWSDNQDFLDKAKLDNTQEFNIYQRARFKFEFVSNENLKAVLYTEVGAGTWGLGAFALGGDAVGIEVKNAYVDFNWPGTEINIKAGLQGLILPGAVAGSYILDDDVAAVAVSGSITDNVGFVGIYARAAQGTQGNATSNAQYDNYSDVWAFVLPLSFDGIKLDPFFALNTQGAQVNNAVPGWWLGAAMTLDMFDPIVVKADLNYGARNGEVDARDASGWVFDLSVAYTGLDFVTPELVFAYSTGEDDKATNGSERMPTISNYWVLGNYFFAGDWGQGNRISGYGNFGFWALGLNLKDISFLEGLKHDIGIFYFKGTNDKDGRAANALSYGNDLTDKDSVFEITLKNSYSIYDELTAFVELGWVDASYDTSVWGANSNGGSAYKFVIGAHYKF